MSEQFKTIEPERYALMTERNKTSRYMNDVDRPFSVTMSVHSAGKERVMYNVFDDPDPSVIAAGKAANRLIKYPIPGNRFPLAGNMSTAVNGYNNEPYGSMDLPPEKRLQEAYKNMENFMAESEVDPATVRVLNPDRFYDTPLQVVNIDDDPTQYSGLEPAKLEGRGDMIYTYNPNIVLGVRPVDCPLLVLSAETPKGRIYTMVHFAWQGAAVDQISDMERELAVLGVDLSTVTAYLTPGGHAETFPFTSETDLNKKYPTAEGLFNTPEPYETDDKTKYDFSIDTPNFVYEGLLKLGLEPNQIFVDTSDTTAPNSGYSSHGRAVRLNEDNNRDFVLVRLEPAEGIVKSNPERPIPPELEWQIIPLSVEYYDFEGNLQQGEIEINRAVYDDVKDFFALAKELRYPIDKVVKSSDAAYEWDDDKLMADNTSSGFNYRFIKGTTNPSLHGLGQAFDVNTRLNPYIRHNKDGTVSVDPIGAVYDPTQPGVLTAEHPLVVFMKDRGWDWGGDWGEDKTRPDDNGRTDYQHFEKRIA